MLFQNAAYRKWVLFDYQEWPWWWSSFIVIRKCSFMFLPILSTESQHREASSLEIGSLPLKVNLLTVLRKEKQCIFEPLAYLHQKTQTYNCKLTTVLAWMTMFHQLNLNNPTFKCWISEFYSLQLYVINGNNLFDRVKNLVLK